MGSASTNRCYRNLPVWSEEYFNGVKAWDKESNVVADNENPAGTLIIFNKDYFETHIKWKMKK